MSRHSGFLAVHLFHADLAAILEIFPGRILCMSVDSGAGREALDGNRKSASIALLNFGLREQPNRRATESTANRSFRTFVIIPAQILLPLSSCVTFCLQPIKRLDQFGQLSHNTIRAIALAQEHHLQHCALLMALALFGYCFHQPPLMFGQKTGTT